MRFIRSLNTKYINLLMVFGAVLMAALVLMIWTNTAGWGKALVLFAPSIAVAAVLGLSALSDWSNKRFENQAIRAMENQF